MIKRNAWFLGPILLLILVAVVASCEPRDRTASQANQLTLGLVFILLALLVAAGGVIWFLIRRERAREKEQRPRGLNASRPYQQPDNSAYFLAALLSQQQQQQPPATDSFSQPQSRDDWGF